MVEPATHVGAVLGLELDDEVPLVRTIGAHPEVTLGHTYALSLDHKIVLDLGDHVESQSVEHAREDPTKPLQCRRKHRQWLWPRNGKDKIRASC